MREAALQRLLDSAVALRLLAWRGDQRYGLGALGAPIAAFPGIQAMIEHHATLYQDLQDPLALLRDGPIQPQMNGYWPYVNSPASAQALSLIHISEPTRH